MPYFFFAGALSAQQASPLAPCEQAAFFPPTGQESLVQQAPSVKAAATMAMMYFIGWFEFVVLCLFPAYFAGSANNV